jgi:hypothetical protein
LIDATITGIVRSPDTPREVTREDARCLATAIVDGFGVDVLRSHGLGALQLRRTDVDLSALKAVSSIAVGQHVASLLDRCDLGHVFGAAIATAAATSGADLAQGECIGRELRRPEFGSYLVQALIGESHRTRALSRNALGVVAWRCLDFGKMMQAGLKLSLSSSERSCMVVAARTTPGYRAALIAAITKDRVIDPAIANTVGQSVFNCLSPANQQRLRAQP